MELSSRNNKNRETENSDDDKNHKYRKKSWSEEMAGQGGARDVKSSTTAPPTTSALAPKTFYRRKTYTGDQVFAILAIKKIPVKVSSSEEEGDGEWRKHKSRHTTKRERAVQASSRLAARIARAHRRHAGTVVSGTTLKKTA